MLDGIRVLDLSRVIAGPYCAAFLADLGADVVKVERPPLGDDLRNLRGRNGMSASFAAINRNKRGIALISSVPRARRSLSSSPAARTSWWRTSCPALPPSSGSGTKT